MARYSDRIVNQYSQPVAGASVYVYTFQGALADLEEDGGGALDNPVTSDEQGNFYFNADDGLYTLTVHYGGRQIYQENYVQVGTGPELPEEIVAALAQESAASGIGASGPSTVQGNLDALSLGPFVNLGSIEIPPDMDRIATSGAAATSDGGDATYVLDEQQTAITTQGAILKGYGVANGLSAPTAEGHIVAAEQRFRRADAGGRYFTLSNQTRLAESFRLAADTDATWLQGYADWLSCWLGTGEIGPGIYTISTTVFLTRGFLAGGSEFYTRSLFVGAGQGFFGGTNMRGTELIFTATDRPGLAIQGGRHVAITGIGLTGPSKDFILDNNLGTQISELDETDPATWDDPASEERWAPCAAVAVDPLYGAAPADPYPSGIANNPPWIGTQTLYGRPVTSVVNIDEVNITGWAVAVAVHPSSGDAQSDFVTCDTVGIECFKWGFSVGNTQSRQTELRKVRFNRGYCAITNRHIGDLTGQLSCGIIDCSFGALIKMFDLMVQNAGAVTLLSPYSEQILYIGDLITGGSVDSTLRIEGGHLVVWTPGIDTRCGVWPYIIGEPDAPYVGNTTTTLSLSDTLLQVLDLCPLMVARLECDNLFINVVSAQSDAATTARAMAQNGTLGLVTPHGARSYAHVIQSQIYDLNDVTGTVASLGTTKTDLRHRDTSRQTCVPYWLQRATPKNHLDNRYAVDIPSHTYETAKSSFSAYSQTGRELTFTGWSGGDTNFAKYYCQSPGRVFIDSESGIWWYVKSWNYTTGAVVAEALTGWRDLTGENDGANDELYIEFDNSTGSFEFIETGFYTPAEILLGDTTSGSPTVSNLRRPDGDQTWLTGQVAAGDWLWIDPQDAAPLFTLYGNKVTAFDAGAHTMTMAGNATATVTGQRFALFMRGT